ncbi:exocyst complex component SEC10b isoform X2 [Selaginella moellendorffii]|uniref:exocyst complex component SEC10b isoform X2 n=1 Tax=Selaginella moellendorffii TaxID=88036 RepID=UPI000D1C5215|nr:exocyst complex component SEC10b isoform X2 [Selaginella moellendorffii]|eukprot:XP_024517817.1 exocyst complex component SEC10b isoform X2 [Selaginella moellendorffii]
MPSASGGKRSAAKSGVSLSIKDFQGDFSFDAFFNNLVGDILKVEDGEKPPPQEDAASNGQKLVKPAFAEANALLARFKEARKQLLELGLQADAQLEKVKKEVSAEDIRHRTKLSELEKGVHGLFDSFSKLDNRISGVGQTAARIGDHLQSADAQRETATQTIELIKYLMEFNTKSGDLMGLSPLFSDDNRVAEAAAIAQKLRALAEEDIGGTGSGATGTTVKGTANANPGLEVAVANLQEYCNELENRLLDRFDAASQKKELSTMGECAKILSQFNRGARAMQRYVASRPMFLDVEVMNEDTRTVLGDQTTDTAAPGSPQPVADTATIIRGLGKLYKEITDTVRRESATVSAVFPSPDAVMSILVQRVMEQRVFAILDKLLVKPNLASTALIEEGGLLQHLKLLAATYEKTQAFAKDLRALGCGELDVEVLAESLFTSHRDDYIELEQASLSQMFEAKVIIYFISPPLYKFQQMAEVRAALPPPPDIGPRGSKMAAFQNFSQPSLTTEVVTEFVRWNEEAVLRCSLLTGAQPGSLASNVRAIFTCLLEQVNHYITAALERGQDALREAAALRERFAIGTAVSRRVAAAAASAAEAAANAGEISVSSFMTTVQRATTNVAIVQQYFVNTIARILLPVDGAHAACCEEIATSMSHAEDAVLKGLQLCMDSMIAEAERLLALEQKVHDYQPSDDGSLPDHRPTNACTRVVAFLSRMLDSTNTALDVSNRQVFVTELGCRLYKSLITHWQRFTFSPSGGLRLKRDVTEFAEFVRSFKAPTVDEKFELLGTMVNIFIVAPESLKTLVDGSLRNASKDAIRFIQLREDYKSAKLSNIVNQLAIS